READRRRAVGHAGHRHHLAALPCRGRRRGDRSGHGRERDPTNLTGRGTAEGLAMARDPNIPDALDVYTLVLLRRPPDAPEMPEAELDALQARHLAYRAGLRREGVLVANGPLDEQSDPAMRGLSIFACG